jgi:hypothetical protein
MRTPPDSTDLLTHSQRLGVQGLVQSGQGCLFPTGLALPGRSDQALARVGAHLLARGRKRLFDWHGAKFLHLILIPVKHRLALYP